MGTLPSPQNPVFFNAKNLWANKYTRDGASFHYKNINEQSFAIFLDNFLIISLKEMF